MEIFSHTFMQYAFIGGTIIGILAPLLGNFIVAQRGSILPHTLTHAAFFGVALGIFLEGNISFWGIFITLICAFLIEFFSQKNIFPEALHSLFLYGGIALAISFVHFSENSPLSLETLFTGNILTITSQDIFLLSIIGVFSLIILFLFWNTFLSLSISEDFSFSLKNKILLFRFLFVSLVALLVAVSLKIIGGLLIGAIIVIPVMAAMHFSQSFQKNALFSVIIGLLSVYFGLFSTYYLYMPSGAAIVLSAILFYFLSLILQKK